MTTTSSQHAGIQAAIEAFNRHDAAGFAQLYAEDCVAYDPFYPEPLRGREAVQKDMEDMFRAFPDIRASARYTVEGGRLVAEDHAVSGTHTGPLASPDGDIAPTGRSIAVDTAHVFVFNDQGKVVEDRRYFDVAGWFQQLGLA